MSKFHDKLLKFVEEEQKAGIDQALLDELRGYLLEDTMYWDWPPERRNALNAFFKEIHSMLEAELLTGKYGASTIVDSIIVTAFEAGTHWGASEQMNAELRNH